MLQILPVLFYKLSSEIKQEALQNRLNLIGYLSHEMRTPLNTAYLGLEYVNSEMRAVKEKMTEFTQSSLNPVDRKEYPSEQVLELVSGVLSPIKLDDMLTTSCHVLDSCEIASQTLNDLLTVDKIGEGKLVVALQPCNPWSLVKKCTGPFSINANDKEINFACDSCDKISSPITVVGSNTSNSLGDIENAASSQVNISVECPERDWRDEYYVDADEFKVNQVLRNLLSNALKFTPRKGHVFLLAEILPHDPKTSKVSTKICCHSNQLCDNFIHRIQVFSVSGNNFDRVLRISVRDSGPGISLDDQAKLFGKYVQFNPGMLQKGNGSGLGLWISKSN